MDSQQGKTTLMPNRPADAGFETLSGTGTNTPLSSALKLHQYLARHHWDGRALIGPDVGVRFSARIGRFVKSYLPFIRWSDSYYYLQAQGYWVLANWRLLAETGDPAYKHIALSCTEQIRRAQRHDGGWDYPNREWKGRTATVEGIWASLGLMETCRATHDQSLLAPVLRWTDYLFREVGFDCHGDEVAVNYFAHMGGSMVPNNSTDALRFFAELADVTKNKAHLQQCPGMVAFLQRVQKPNGELPYSVRTAGRSGKCWEHFQCYQYNAFECLGLMRYYELTGDPGVRRIIDRSLAFLRTGVAIDGHIFFDCDRGSRRVFYHAGVIAAVFATAHRLGMGSHDFERRAAVRYLVESQKPDGSFAYSQGDYGLLCDRRAYPRQLSMILLHLLMNVRPEIAGGEN